jgi:hypothetical protein
MNAKKIVEPKKIETSDENKDVSSQSIKISSQSIKKKSSFGIKKPIPDKADIPKKENIIESLVVSQNSGFEITDEGLYYNSIIIAEKGLKDVQMLIQQYQVMAVGCQAVFQLQILILIVQVIQVILGKLQRLSLLRFVQ